MRKRHRSFPEVRPTQSTRYSRPRGRDPQIGSTRRQNARCSARRRLGRSGRSRTWGSSHTGRRSRTARSGPCGRRRSRVVGRCEPLRKPPAFAAVCGLNRPLRLAVSILAFDERVSALVCEGARQTRRHHRQRRGILNRARHHAVTRSTSRWSGRAPIFLATKSA